MNIEATSNVTTASNYAKDFELDRPLHTNGPYVHRNMRVPHKVLTKTHCFGYCDDCGPAAHWLGSVQDFENGCRRSEPPGNGAVSMYDVNVVKSAVHLIQNPLDNIVSRMMHLAIKKRQQRLG